MFHVAIIMDGNGRWATRRGLPRLAGHREGAQALRRVLEAGPGVGITDLTVYAFSADNWKRPAPEVSGLWMLLEEFVSVETAALVEKGVRWSAIGRRDRIPSFARDALERAEQATAGGQKLHLRVALDYSSRQQIREARFTPDVDLLIRTAGEQRLSDFLLWECAYAEFYFTPRLWPDFDEEDLGAAVASFGVRERKFGGIALPAGAVTGQIPSIPAR